MLLNNVMTRCRLAKKMSEGLKRAFGTVGLEKLYGHGDSLHPTYLPRPGSGKSKKVAVIPGPGIGSLLFESVEEIFDHCNIRLNFEKFADVNSDNVASLQRLSAADAILRGPIKEGFMSKDDIFLPQKLDLFAYVVHAFSIPGITTKHKDVDIVVIRENSEGEYSTIEHEVLPGVVQSIKVTTKEKSKRIAEYAFEYAMLSNRSKVTCVHKANIIKKGDGDFLKAAREVSENYPRIKYEEMIVDAACMNVISHPEYFEVILLPNLYGSIIGNVVAGLVGGAGIAPGANIGMTTGMFEQGARCSGIDHLLNRDANPTAFILSACMMLRYLSLPSYADMIQKGVFRALKAGVNLTSDIGGKGTTKDFTKEVIKNIY